MVEGQSRETQGRLLFICKMGREKTSELNACSRRPAVKSWEVHSDAFRYPVSEKTCGARGTVHHKSTCLEYVKSYIQLKYKKYLLGSK